MTGKSDLKLIARALSFAAHKHRDQRRKDVEASPYINHPIALFDHLVNVGDIADIEILCAALLHDTVEDTETSPEVTAKVNASAALAIPRSMSSASTVNTNSASSVAPAVPVRAAA